jgi:hypothetical protein
MPTTELADLAGEELDKTEQAINERWPPDVGPTG